MSYEMPKLQPVLISTKGKNIFKRVGSWLFSSRKWLVAEDWKYPITINGVDRVIIIKSGFIFDGASVPRVLHSLLSPTGVLLIPGLIHDYAYRYKRVDFIDGDCLRSNDHKVWDRLFCNISKDVNGLNYISDVAYATLFTFGGFAWRSNRKKMNN